MASESKDFSHGLSKYLRGRSQWNGEDIKEDDKTLLSLLKMIIKYFEVCARYDHILLNIAENYPDVYHQYLNTMTNEYERLNNKYLELLAGYSPNQVMFDTLINNLFSITENIHEDSMPKYIRDTRILFILDQLWDAITLDQYKQIIKNIRKSLIDVTITLARYNSDYPLRYLMSTLTHKKDPESKIATYLTSNELDYKNLHEDILGFLGTGPKLVIRDHREITTEEELDEYRSLYKMPQNIDNPLEMKSPNEACRMKCYIANLVIDREKALKLIFCTIFLPPNVNDIYGTYFAAFSSDKDNIFTACLYKKGRNSFLTTSDPILNYQKEYIIEALAKYIKKHFPESRFLPWNPALIVV